MPTHRRGNYVVVARRQTAANFSILLFSDGGALPRRRYDWCKRQRRRLAMTQRQGRNINATGKTVVNRKWD
jgi:hypothetical protein